MSCLNILDLHNDCFGYILQYLSAEDQIHFAQSCTRFRQIFIENNAKNFQYFAIEAGKTKNDLITFCIICENVKTLSIDVAYFDLCSRFNTTHVALHFTNCFDTLCVTLRNMVSLKSLILKQTKIIDSEFVKPFERILAAVKDLSELRSLEINARHVYPYHTIENLCEFQHIQNLYINIPEMSPKTLAKVCKLNPKLQTLHLSYALVPKNLNDIVRHCQNLEELKFGQAAESSAYNHLAKLPKLIRLIHFGIRGSGSFAPLLGSLATRSQLECLVIDGGSLSLQEAQQITRQQRLKELKCFCSTSETVALLSGLPKLEKLCIWMTSNVDISEAMLEILSACQNLQLLVIVVGNLKNEFIKQAEEVLLRVRDLKTQEPLRLELPASAAPLMSHQHACGKSQYLTVDYEARKTWPMQ